MPIHDWSRLDAGVFRDFHNVWYGALRNVMNERVLPKDYYAMVEQTAGNILTNVVTLHAPGHNGHADSGPNKPSGSVALAAMPPQVRLKTSLPRTPNIPTDKQLTIRHVSDDRVVAILEIVSRGNKSSQDELHRFVFKATEAIRLGIHLLIVDLQPPTNRDPQGIHGAICGQMGDAGYTAPPNKPLTLVSYVGMPIGTAYVEPVAVGDVLVPMPLFLDEGTYVNVPLEETYLQTYRGVPWRWKPILEESIAPPATS